jgi:hypothetical protein
VNIVRRIDRDEAGIALMMALLAMLILGGMAAVFMSRANTEARASGASRDHESAVHVAEAAADNQVRYANLDDDHVTRDRSGTMISVASGSLGEEERWALGLLASMRPDETGTASQAWIEVDGGEGYAVRPLDSSTTPNEPMNVVYGVGAVPSFDHPNARVRVIKLQIAQDQFIPEFALLTDGALRFGGNAEIVVPGCDASTVASAQATCIADVHTNQTFTNPGNASVIEGRVSQVEGTCPSGVTATNGCVDSTGGVADREVPEFRARDFYNRGDDFNPDPEGQTVEWYDLCPPGKPVATATVRRPGTEPCAIGSEQVWPLSGDSSSTFRGWKWQANMWQASSVGAGVFYVYHADAKVTGSEGSQQRAVSILVEQNPSAKGSSGALDISGNPKLQAALDSVLFVTDTDLDLHGTATGGTGTSCGDTETSFSGFMGVREQLKTQGTVELRGAIIVRDVADDHNLVQRTNQGVGGTMCLEFDKDLVIDFTGLWVITYWNEL